MKPIFSSWLYDAKAVEGVSFFWEFLPKPCWVAAHSKISTRAMPSLPMVPRNMPLVLKRIA
jgi:hypothetical protein